MVITKGFGSNEGRTKASRNGAIRAKMERKTVIDTAPRGCRPPGAACYHNIIN
jgi:hypothetical protein